MPTVPMLAAGWPSACQIWRVNAATDVLPLVPVTAAMAAGCRGCSRAAASASARRAFLTCAKATASGSASGRCSAMTAVAPAAIAAPAYFRPSAFVAAMATNRSPGRTLRLSAVTPPTGRAAKRGSYAASAGRRSASCMPAVYCSASRVSSWPEGCSPHERSDMREWLVPDIASLIRATERRSGTWSLSLGQDLPVGRRQVEARLDAEHGGDAGDHFSCGRAGIPAGCRKAERLLESLRLVQDDEDLIARLVGRQDGGERGQDLRLRVAPADHLLGGAGLAADVVALDVGLGGRAFLGVEAQEIAHLVAGLRLDHLGSQRPRLLLGALHEGRRNEITAVDQRVDSHGGLQRGHRQAVTERDGHGVELAPVLGHQRLCALGQLRAQAVELAELAQEPFVVLDAERQRHARGSDVG